MKVAKKDALDRSNCDRLSKGLIAEDVTIVSGALKGELTFYNKDNLDKLSVTISDKCNITASVVCFNCVYTYPPQSEVRILVNQSGLSVEKVIDISYTTANSMRIVGVHD